MRKTITARDAEAYRNLVMIRFASWIEADYDEPKVIANWDGDGHFAVVWDGGPYEWAYYGTTGSFAYAEREPEYGIRLPIVKVPDSLSHVFSEPHNSQVVVLYLED